MAQPYLGAVFSGMIPLGIIYKYFKITSTLCPCSSGAPKHCIISHSFTHSTRTFTFAARDHYPGLQMTVCLQLNQGVNYAHNPLLTPRRQ